MYLYTIIGSTGLKIYTNRHDAIDNLRLCWPEHTFTLEVSHELH